MTTSIRVGTLGTPLLAAALCTVPCVGAAQPAPACDRGRAATPGSGPLSGVVARLEAAVPDLMSQAMVPGLAIALVRDGRVAWTRGFGVANAETKAPVTDETVFEAASLTKPVFAYAVMTLVQRGVIDLDTPLTKYLPGRYDVGDDPRFDRITARHVLSHRTGFPNWRPSPRESQPLAIHFEPGERFSYSGEGFVYLSRVVEHVTGQSIEALVRATVFEALGMTSSSLEWQDGYEARKAFNHDALGQVAGRNQPARANAAYSLHTTAGDYARFVAGVLNGTGLAPGVVREMLTTQSQLRSGGPNTIGKAPGAIESEIAWGLGWGLQCTADGPAFWHWGDNGNNRSFVLAYERPKLGLVVFTNAANGLAIVPALVEQALHARSPALAWLDYETYDSPGMGLLRAISAKGAVAAVAQYRTWRSGGSAGERLSEDRVNDLGYMLLRSKRVADAIEIFRLNVDDHPGSWNAHDSLAEAYAAHGDRELAIKHYRRSIELNPDNTNGIEALKKLQGA